MDIDYTSKGLIFDPDFNQWFYDGDIVSKKVADELKLKFKKEEYLRKNVEVFAKLMEAIPVIIDPNISSIEQIKEYKMKYDKAKSGDRDYFKSEAEILGVSIDNVMDKVLSLGSKYEQINNELTAKAGSVKVGVDKLIEAGKFGMADKAFEFVQGINRDNVFSVTIQSFLDAVTGGDTILKVIEQ